MSSEAEQIAFAPRQVTGSKSRVLGDASIVVHRRSIEAFQTGLFAQLVAARNAGAELSARRGHFDETARPGHNILPEHRIGGHKRTVPFQRLIATTKATIERSTARTLIAKAHDPA
jgi:hypothetical protein